MTNLEWQSEFAVGYSQIDRDHQALLAAMNDLRTAADQGQDKAEIAKVLNFLRDYTVTHFRMEEGLMIRHNYPEASAHFAAHANLVMEVSDFIADYRTGNIVGVAEMLAFFERWLMGHIQTLDKDLGVYLASRRIEG